MGNRVVQMKIRSGIAYHTLNRYLVRVPVSFYAVFYDAVNIWIVYRQINKGKAIPVTGGGGP
jgi:hypothetical protein